METYESRRSLHEAVRRSAALRQSIVVEEEGGGADSTGRNTARYSAERPEEETVEIDEEIKGNKSFCQILKEEIVQPKWRLLILLCFMPFGTYYIYDFPSSIGTGEGATIQGRFAEHDKQYNQQMNQALYSVYSYPNTVLAFFGGILIDRLLGLRRSIMLFTTLVLCGSIVFYVGVLTVEYPVILLGRMMFGLGGESLGVSQSALVARWFGGGRGLSFAFGITISCVRMGSSFNFMFSPTIAESRGVENACLVGCFVCAFSTFCCVTLILCDVYYEKRGVVRPQPMGRSDTKLLVRMRTMLRQVGRLPAQYWLLCGVCVSLYGSDFPFVGIAKNFFQVKFGLSSSRASDALSYYQLTSAVASPVVGLIIDRLGRNAFVLAFASIAFFTSHLVMTLTDTDPIAAMVMLGVFYSILVSSLWPSVPYVVSESLSGVAYGAMMSIQNMGSATIPLILGGILDSYTPEAEPLPVGNTTAHRDPPVPSVDGYIAVESVMMTAALCAFVFVCFLIWTDRRDTGGILCVAPTDRSILIRQRNKRDEGEEVPATGVGLVATATAREE